MSQGACADACGASINMPGANLSIACKPLREFISPDLLFFKDIGNQSLCDFYSQDNYTYDPYYPIEETELAHTGQVLPIIFWIIFVIGICGNGVVVYIFLCIKAMRTVTNLYLLNLAIGDILYLATCVFFPSTYWWSWNEHWPFGEHMCKLVNYMMAVTMKASVLTLIAVGIDRHNAILFPIKSKTYRTIPYTIIIIACLWIFAFVVSVPSILIAKEVVFWTYTDTKIICIITWQGDADYQTYSLMMFTFLFVIPQCILGFCYFRIAKKLWLSVRVGMRLNAITVQSLKTRRRVAKTVFIVTSAFALCWLPVHVAELYNSFGTHYNELFYEFKIIAPFFPYSFIAINPLIYCFMSRVFRRHFKAAFTCQKVQIITNAWADDPDFVPGIAMRTSQQTSVALQTTVQVDNENCIRTEITDPILPDNNSCGNSLTNKARQTCPTLIKQSATKYQQTQRYQLIRTPNQDDTLTPIAM